MITICDHIELNRYDECLVCGSPTGTPPVTCTNEGEVVSWWGHVEAIHARENFDRVGVNKIMDRKVALREQGQRLQQSIDLEMEVFGEEASLDNLSWMRTHLKAVRQQQAEIWP